MPNVDRWTPQQAQLDTWIQEVLNQAHASQGGQLAYKSFDIVAPPDPLNPRLSQSTSVLCSVYCTFIIEFLAPRHRITLCQVWPVLLKTSKSAFKSSFPAPYIIILLKVFGLLGRSKSKQCGRNFESAPEEMMWKKGNLLLPSQTSRS